MDASSNRCRLKAKTKSPIIKKFVESVGRLSQEDYKSWIAVVGNQDKSLLPTLSYLYADMAMTKGWDVDTYRLLVLAIKADPYLSGAYLDLGRLFIQEFQVAAGWKCFEIGRMISPEHSQLKVIDKLMNDLERDFPDFF